MESRAGQESRWIAGIEPPSHMLTRSMTSIFEMECREQPERLVQLLRAYREDKPIWGALEQLGRMALSAGPVMLVGMGASYCSSMIASSFLQSSGRLAFAADASEWLHYSRPVWDQAAVSILLTTSGESAELVQLCRTVRSYRSPCFAITKKAHVGHRSK